MFPAVMPSPRLPDPMDAPPLRWGVLGTGWIAERFTAALHRSTRQRVVAVGSRAVGSAKEFADRIGVQRAHGSYADVTADPEVDVVYVATPHNHHRAHALLALDAGKHVLVEKPIALNAAEAQEIADRAAARGVYCAEALWTFCLPRYDIIRQLLDDGVLGDMHTVLADNGEWLPATTASTAMTSPVVRYWTWAYIPSRWRTGYSANPRELIALGQGVPGGEVNGQVSMVLHHTGDAQSAINTTIMADTPTQAVLAGTQATLVIEGPFYTPGNLTVVSAGKKFSIHWSEPPIAHQALYVTAVEAAHRIAAGETATPLRSLADSVATFRVIDEVRRQIGITFVEERAPGVPHPNHRRG